MPMPTGNTSTDLATIIKMLKELERKLEHLDHKVSSIKSRV